MKLPLKYCPQSDGKYSNVRDANNNRIATDLRPDAAALIVTACNAHDQLVAENAALREQLERRTEAANGSINAALMLPDPVREQSADLWRDGALMALSVLVSIHDQPTMAAHVLNELGLNNADCSDLDEFDKVNLRKIQKSERNIKLRGLANRPTTNGAAGVTP